MYYVTTFNYDTRDMLTEEKYLRWDAENSNWMVMYLARYKYDTAGNMVARDVKQIYGGDAKSYTDTMTYSRGYQLTQLTRTVLGEGTDTITFTYDANGNLTHIEQDGGFIDPFYDITEMEFEFDKKNRLTKYRFNGEGDWYEIRYDALGRVRERVDLTPTTTKYYSDGRQLVQQLDNSNNVQFDYLRGPTGLDRQWNEGNDTRRFYIKDNLGTVWAIVNSSDMKVKRYNYNAWGEHLDATDINFPDYTSNPNLMRYIGCRVEAFGKGMETQWDAIHHLDFRHFLPVLSKFIQYDPLFLGKPYTKVLHPYLYPNNNPSNNYDPLGLGSGVFWAYQPELCDFSELSAGIQFAASIDVTCGHQYVKNCIVQDDWFCACCCPVLAWLLPPILPENGISLQECCFRTNIKPVIVLNEGRKSSYDFPFDRNQMLRDICNMWMMCLCTLYNKGIINGQLPGHFDELTRNVTNNCINALCKNALRQVYIHLIDCDNLEKGELCRHPFKIGKPCDYDICLMGCAKHQVEKDTYDIYLCVDCLKKWGHWNYSDVMMVVAHELLHACGGLSDEFGILREQDFVERECYGQTNISRLKCKRTIFNR